MDVFGTRLRASEGAYFKTEAERDLERLAAERRRRRRRADESTTMELDGRVDESVASETSTSSRARAAHEYAMRGNATRGGVDKLASVGQDATEGGAASVERSAVVQNLRKRLRVARPAQSTST